MSYSFIVGGSCTRKTSIAIDELIKSACKEKNRTHIVLVPEQYTMQVQKEIFKRHPKKSSFNIDVLSFNRLYLKVFKELSLEVEGVLDDVSKSIVLRKIAKENEKDLKVWKDKFGKYGFLEKFKSLISELEQYNISLLELENILSNKDKIKNDLLYSKLKDIHLIYKAFIDFSKNKHISNENILNVLAKYIHKSKFLKDSYIVYDAFTGFSKAQENVISELLLLAKKNIFIVTARTENLDKKNCDIDNVKFDEDSLFCMSYKMARNISKIANKLSIKKEESIYLEKSCFKSSSLEHLEKNFLKENKEVIDTRDDIEVVATKNKEEEVKYVVNKINYLIKKEDYRYSDIAIFTGDLESYADKFRSRFIEEKIPYHIDDNIKISNNILIDFIISIFELVSNNYSYASVLRYLKNPLNSSFFSIKDISSFDNYLYCSGINTYHKLSKKFSYLPKTYQGVDLERLESIRDIILETSKGFKTLYKKNKEKISIKKILNEYRRVFKNLNIEKKLEEIAESYFKDEAEKFREYSLIYDEVLKIFDKMEFLLQDEELEKKEFIDIFKASISELKLGIIPQNEEMIFVGDIIRSRINRRKAVFILGLNEGSIPKVSDKYSLVSDRDKKILSEEFDLNLSNDSEKDLYEQKYYCYLNFTKPNEKLYLSFSRLDDNLESLSSSSMLEEILKLYKNIKVEEYESSSLINSYKELEEYLVKNIETKDFYEFIKDKKNISYKILEKYKSFKDIFNYEYKAENIEEFCDFIFGKKLKASVSSLETYAACPYKYFLSYGFMLNERKEYSLGALDVGNLVHASLEYIFKERIKKGDKYFLSSLLKDNNKKLNEIVNQIIEKDEFAMYLGEAKNKYLISRVLDLLALNIKIFDSQLRGGKFEVKEIERVFKDEIKLLENKYLELVGKIDRIDTYNAFDDFDEMSEIDSKKDYEALKVIDYKTGSSKFSEKLALAGLRMQLVFYLGMYMKLYKEEYKKNIEAGAVFYTNLSEKFIKKEKFSEEVKKIEEERNEKLEEKDLEKIAEFIILEENKPEGIINKKPRIIKALDRGLFNDESKESKLIGLSVNKKEDENNNVSWEVKSNKKSKELFSSEEIGELIEKVNSKIKELGENILSGKIDICPISEVKYSCKYCSYSSICSFDKSIKGFKSRKVEEE